jgi:hypothetical protein
MTELISALDQKDFCNYMKDTHNTPTVGKRKPDIVHSRQDHPENTFNIVCLGELKGRRNGAQFTNDEKGQILDTTLALARLQPFRNEFTCYLTDTKFIQFFKIVVTRKVRFESI